LWQFFCGKIFCHRKIATVFCSKIFVANFFATKILLQKEFNPYHHKGLFW